MGEWRWICSHISPWRLRKGLTSQSTPPLWSQTRCSRLWFPSVQWKPHCYCVRSMVSFFIHSFILFVCLFVYLFFPVLFFIFMYYFIFILIKRLCLLNTFVGRKRISMENSWWRAQRTHFWPCSKSLWPQEECWLCKLQSRRGSSTCYII